MRFTSKVMPIMYSVLWWVLFLFDRLTTSPYWLWQPLCMCNALFWNWQCETHSLPSMWKWCPDLLLFKVFSRHYGNMPTWPMLILNLFESHKLFAPFLKLTAFEPDDAFLWHRFSAAGEIWFSTQTRGQIYICYSLKPKTWKSELIRIPYICCWMSLFWPTGRIYWNIYRKFENGGKRNVLRKQQTQDLHSKRAPASKSGVCCAFDISIEGWVEAFIRERAANKSFPGVKTSQIPTEGKYGTSCNPVLSTLNERGNRRRGRMAEASWGKMRLWSHPGIS